MTIDKCRLFRRFPTGLRRQIGIGVLVAGVLAVLAFGQSESPAQIPDDEYVVLSAVLDHFAGEGNDLEPNQKFVVWDRTSHGPFYPDSLKRSVESKPKPSPNSGTSEDLYHRRNSLDPVHRERLEQMLEMKRKEQVDGAAFKEEVSAEAVSDWTEKNANSYPLEHKLDVKKGAVVLFSDDDWRQLETCDASLSSQWQAFDAR